MKRWHAVPVLAAFAVLAAVGGVAQAGLVGYWTFDGDNINDSSGNNYNGTLVSGSYSTDTPVALAGGKSINLTGGGDYAIIDSAGAEAPFDLPGGITVSCWVKGWPNDGWEPFVSKRGEGNEGWQLRRRGGEDRETFTLRATSGDDDRQGWAKLDDGQWHHIVGTYNGTARAVYVDGKLDLLINDTGNIGDSNALVVFGARDNSESSGPHVPSVGNVSQIRMDNVAIFDQALAPNQVAFLKAGGDATALPAAQTAPLLKVGPPAANGVFGIREVRNNRELWSVGATAGSLLSGTGTIVDGTAPMVNFNDPNDAGGGGYFGNAGKAPFLSNTGGGDDDIAFIANAGLEIRTPGTYTFGFSGDDGSQLRILGASFTKKWGGGVAFGDTILFGEPTGNSDTAASTYLDAGVYPLEFLFFERGGGAFVELWAAQGDYGSFDANAFHLIGDVANGGLRVLEIPEPVTLTLAGLALAGLGGYLRRRRHA